MRFVRSLHSFPPPPLPLQNLVRDATSNTNDLPTPPQLQRIGEACAYSDSYALVFGMLHKRLTHLEYKRHVVKALLVLDYLIRIRPPSVAIQLKLILDVREHWEDVWRLAKLRVQSSSGTVQQIQRVAERLCDFIFRVEQGEVEAGVSEPPAGDPSTKKKKKKRSGAEQRKKKKKRAAESSSSSSSDTSSSSDSDAGEEGSVAAAAPQKDILSPSRMPNFSFPAAPKQVDPVSPFGFDFGFWSDQGAAAQQQQQKQMPNGGGAGAGKGSVLAHRPGGAPGGAQHEDPFAGLDDKSWNPNWNSLAPPQATFGGGHGGAGIKHHNAHSPLPPLEAVDWPCPSCTFMNPSDQSACVMCTTARPGSAAGGRMGGGHSRTNSTGSTGGAGMSSSIAKPMLSLNVLSPLHSSGPATGGWTCRFCSFQNPIGATVCHVCDHSPNGLLDEHDFAAEEERLHHASMNTDGSMSRGQDDGEEKKMAPVPTPRASPPRASQLGARASTNRVACSWCQYLNPVGATRCEICEKDLGASLFAQQVKLQMALKTAIQQQRSAQPWQCVGCTHINAAHTMACVRCKFEPLKMQLPTVQQLALADVPETPASAIPSQSVGRSSQAQSNTAAAFNQGLPADAFSKSRLPGGPIPPTGEVLGPKPTLSSRPGSVSTPSPLGSPALSSAASSASSSASVSRAGSLAHAPEYMPDSDLLALLQEQNEAPQMEGVPFNGDAAAAVGDPHDLHEKNVLDQVAAMSTYHEMASEIKAGKWSCAHCSFLNFPQDLKCEMCGLVKPSPGNPFSGDGLKTYTPTGNQAAVEQQWAASVNESKPQQGSRQGAQQQQQKPSSAALPQQQQPMTYGNQQQQGKPQQKWAQPQGRVAGSQAPSQSQPPSRSANVSPPKAVPAVNPFDMLDLRSSQSQLQQPHPALAHAQPKSQSPAQSPHMHQLHPSREQQQQQQLQQQQGQRSSQQPAARPPVHHSAPQHAAGSAPKDSSPKEWSCETCTYLNAPGKDTCGMCEQPRAAGANVTGSTGALAISSSTSRPASKSRDNSPHATGRRASGGAGSLGSSPDPYSSLLAAGISHSTSPSPIPKLAGRSLSLAEQQQQAGGSRSHSPALTALAPPKEQPMRHRGSGSTPNSRNASMTVPEGGFGVSPLLQPSRDQLQAQSEQKLKAGTLPSGFKLPPQQPPQERDSSFNSFDPAFPAADAFSHLHVGTGPKSPPALNNFSHTPDPSSASASARSRQPSIDFDSMFSANADLFARQVVGAIPGPDGRPVHAQSSPLGHAADDFDRAVGGGPSKLDTSERGLAAVGEDGGEDDEQRKPKRTKEEREARRKEKEERRLRKERRRAARAEEIAAIQHAQALVDEETARIEAAARAHGPYTDHTARMEAAAVAAAEAASLADLAAKKAARASAAALSPTDARKPQAPELPHSPRPVLLTKPQPQAPPPVPPMPVLPSAGKGVAAAAAAAAAVAPPAAASPVGSAGVLSPAPPRSPAPSPGVPLDEAQLRQKVIDEIKSTEKLYVEALFDVIQHFMEPLKKLGPKMGVTPKQIALIFSNISVLAQFHSLFLADLNKSDASIIEVFVQLSDFLKMYTHYLNGYERSIATINSLRANSKFGKLLEEKRDLLKGRGLMTFLIMPVRTRATSVCTRGGIESQRRPDADCFCIVIHCLFCYLSGPTHSSLRVAVA